MVVFYVIILLSLLGRVIGGLICTKERRPINEEFGFFLLSIFARTFAKVEVSFFVFLLCFLCIVKVSNFFPAQEGALGRHLSEYLLFHVFLLFLLIRGSQSFDCLYLHKISTY
jgi:hypothetical protein